MTDLTAERLRSLLDYDSETGVFRWRPREELNRQLKGWNTKFAGKPAGGRHQGHERSKTDYVCIGIGYRNYLAHRLAWLYVHGEWPALDIDHIDMDGTNNAIANLRLATNTENTWNRSKHRCNTSGFKGVSWSKCKGRWRAEIRVGGRHKHLGYFSDPDTAHQAYAAAAIALRGEFARVS